LLLWDLFVHVLDHERTKIHSDLGTVGVEILDEEVRRLLSGNYRDQRGWRENRE